MPYVTVSISMQNRNLQGVLKMIALDTNVLIEIERGNEKVVSFIEEFKQKYPEPALPFPVFSEYYYGYLRKGRKRVDEALHRLEVFELLHSTKGSAALFSEIKYQLEKSGRIIPDMDILIACIAVDRRATLLTYDKQFKSIENLDVIILEK